MDTNDHEISIRSYTLVVHNELYKSILQIVTEPKRQAKGLVFRFAHQNLSRSIPWWKKW